MLNVDCTTTKNIEWLLSLSVRYYVILVHFTFDRQLITGTIRMKLARLTLLRHCTNYVKKYIGVASSFCQTSRKSLSVRLYEWHESSGQTYTIVNVAGTTLNALAWNGDIQRNDQCSEWLFVCSTAERFKSRTRTFHYNHILWRRGGPIE